MNFRTATLLVLGMFGSFAVVIATMVALFWTPSKKPARSTTKTPPAKSAPAIQTSSVGAKLDTPQTATPEIRPDSVDVPGVAAETVVAAETSTEQLGTQTPTKTQASRPKSGNTGRKAQEILKVEQQEKKLLQLELERRLRESEKAKLRNLDLLARQCNILGAGDAIEILMTLDDADVRHVLLKMDKNISLQAATMLIRLGRNITPPAQSP